LRTNIWRNWRRNIVWNVWISSFLSHLAQL
jgi:hypothetical protein